MRLCFDIEATNLLNASSVDYTASPYRLRENFKIHSAVFIDVDTNEEYTFVQDEVYTKMVPFILENATELIGHNIIAYDLLVLKAALGLDYEIGTSTGEVEGKFYSRMLDKIGGKPITITDTLVMSKCLNPDRLQHSIAYFGKMHGEEKIDWRAKAVELGLIAHDAPKGAEFLQYHPEMLVYNKQDVISNIKTWKFLLREWGDWNWKDAYELEKAVAEIITRQEHRGFWFDSDKAVEHVKELDERMEKLKVVVEPLIPPKPLGKTAAKEFIPPKIQFKKNGDLSANIVKWVEKHGGKIEKDEGGYFTNLYDSTFAIPIAQDPIVTHAPAKINDTTHIKSWLVGDLGWEPSAYKERDLTVDSKKHKLSQEKYIETCDRYIEQTLNSPFKKDRMEHLEVYSEEYFKKKLYKHDHMKRPMKVLTNPTLTVGMEKEIDPNLSALGEKFAHAKDVSDYLTYSHRRNSILGGGVDPDDEDEEAQKGWLSVERIQQDHRIPTPADTCGAGTSRFKHRLVANIPRVTSPFGKEMRELFGVNFVDGFFQMGYDFASLEAMIESHYCVPMSAKALTRQGWKTYDELIIGELVLAYNAGTGEKEWTPLRGKVKYENSLTYNLKWKSHSYRATGSHRWYVKQRNTVTKEYEAEVRTTDELNTASNIIVNAPFNRLQDSSTCPHGLVQGKYEVDWVQRVLEMSQAERMRFLEGFMIADGYWHKHKQTPVWRWAQNDGDLFEAALTASYLVHDKGITVANNSKNSPKVKIATLNVNGHITCQRMTKEVYGLEDVWCPQTDLGTWVMRQGDCITITGNCWKYDDEDKDYCKSLTLEKPNDVHTKTAAKISEVLGREFKRTPSKSVKYCCAYGGQPKRVAKTVGCSVEDGAKIHAAYWDAAKPLALLAEKLKVYWESTGGKKFILGLDGRKIPTRSASALINSLFQSAGVICAKRAMVLHDRKLKESGLSVDFWKDDWKAKAFVQQLIAYHDESQLEMHKSLIKWKLFPTEEEAKAFKTENSTWSEVGHSAKGYYVGLCKAGELIQEAVRETSEYYKLNVTLSADYILGRNWAECH